MLPSFGKGRCKGLQCSYSVLPWRWPNLAAGLHLLPVLLLSLQPCILIMNQHELFVIINTVFWIRCMYGFRL